MVLLDVCLKSNFILSVEIFEAFTLQVKADDWCVVLAQAAAAEVVPEVHEAVVFPVNCNPYVLWVPMVSYKILELALADKIK